MFGAVLLAGQSVKTGYGSDVTGGSTVTGDARFSGLSNLIDNDTGTGTGDSSSGAPCYTQFQLSAAKAVEQLKMTSSAANPSRVPTAFTLKASNTGSFSGEEVTMYTASGLSWAGSQETKTFQWDNTTAYTYWRITATTLAGKWEWNECEMMEGVYS